MSLPQHNYGYPYSFTVDKRQKIEAYLAYKWGIQNDLPDDHPYKYQQASTTVAPIAPESITPDLKPKKPVDLVVERSPKAITSIDTEVVTSPEPVVLIDATDQSPSPVTNLNAGTIETFSDLSVSTYNGTKDLEMIWVEPGTFTMGSPTTEDGRVSEREEQHEVTLTQGFYLGRYEVTQAQYESVMTGNTNGLSATPSWKPNNPDRPIEMVSWNDIQVFLTRLNAQQASNIPTGYEYALPTDAQWEYACRAGTTTVYSWGDTISANDAHWNWDGNAEYIISGNWQTRDVGQYAANPWGFFDMHGNVNEYVADWFSWATSGAQTDPVGPSSGTTKVHRGGSWYDTGTVLRSAHRNANYPTYRNQVTGFRVALVQT